MRRDVKRIAEKTAALTNNKLDSDTLYYFFLKVCKAENIRPAALNARLEGNWILAGNNSRISINPIHFPAPVLRSWTNDNGPDYEGMILARQEAYMD